MSSQDVHVAKWPRTAHVCDRGVAIAGPSALAVAGVAGVAIAGEGGTATAGMGGVLVIAARDESDGWVQVSGVVDGCPLRPNVTYCVGPELTLVEVLP
jgi:hypothetical protein